MKRKAFFTLAEVLITLAVIGVVAAMSIPAVMNSTNKQETVVKLKKVYVTLDSAEKMLRAQGITMKDLYAGDFQAANIGNNFVSVISSAQMCGIAKYSNCFSNEMYKYLDGTSFRNYESTNLSKMKLNDGTLMAFYDSAGSCVDVGGTGPFLQSCGDVEVDVNGSVGPNQMGRDLFVFKVTTEGIFPQGNVYDTSGYGCDPNGSANDKLGWGCAGKVLQAGAINY